LDFIEQSTPRFAISAHRSGIEVLDQSADADIEIDKAEEAVVSPCSGCGRSLSNRSIKIAVLVPTFAASLRNVWGVVLA
ncbi:hypothetical protein, partial [Rhizobium ruizarguesonis]|uniref:hypothetical protein n=1 Tax=Rhizobium ruizarguesonis TaxID=2081791 RepID=UPI0013EECD12